MLELGRLEDTVAPMTHQEDAAIEQHDDNPDLLAGELVEPDHDLVIAEFEDESDEDEVDR